MANSDVRHVMKPPYLEVINQIQGASDSSGVISLFRLGAHVTTPFSCLPLLMVHCPWMWKLYLEGCQLKTQHWATCSDLAQAVLLPLFSFLPCTLLVYLD